MVSAVCTSSGSRCAVRNPSDRLAEAALRHARHYGFGDLARHAPGKHDASEGFNLMHERIDMRSRLWSALIGGPLTPAGCGILAVIAIAILLCVMLSTCWGGNGLDRVLRVGWWFW
jgi:hypothetical protein